MKLIVGAPVKDRAWILPRWLRSIADQDVELELVCLLSPSEDDTEAVLKQHPIELLYDVREGRSVSEINAHVWAASSGRYTYMSELRNRLVEYALDNDADYFFSLDSDIILPEGGLKELLAYAEHHDGVIAPAVNMTSTTVAWNVMEWSDPDHPGTGLAQRTSKNPPDGPADIIMAAMLLDRKGLQCRWQAHHQGEDVGFCVDAASKGVPRWWMSQIRCEHAMIRTG